MDVRVGELGQGLGDDSLATAKGTGNGSCPSLYTAGGGGGEEEEEEEEKEEDEEEDEEEEIGATEEASTVVKCAAQIIMQYIEKQAEIFIIEDFCSK